MTKDQANATRKGLIEMGFTNVQLHEFGWMSGVYHCEIRGANAAAGNHHLYVIRDYPATDAEIKYHVKAARGKASDRDKAAFARIAAAKEQDLRDNLA